MKYFNDMKTEIAYLMMLAGAVESAPCLLSVPKSYFHNNGDGPAVFSSGLTNCIYITL